MKLLRLGLWILLTLITYVSYGQNPKSKVNIELSIPHTREIPWFNMYSDKDNVHVIIRNNSDSLQYFYEDWNSFGYFNISFEIKYQDSIHSVVRPPRLWWRNFPSYHTVRPHESLVFPHMLIDTSYANALRHDRIFENGWIGFPAVSDTVEIRVIYQLCDPGEEIAEENIGRLNYRKDNYIDYLDGDIESELDKTSEPKTPPISKPTIIFNEPLISEWQKVILH